MRVSNDGRRRRRGVVDEDADLRCVPDTLAAEVAQTADHGVDHGVVDHDARDRHDDEVSRADVAPGDAREDDLGESPTHATTHGRGPAPSGPTASAPTRAR